jgi:hypothetical protein
MKLLAAAAIAACSLTSSVASAQETDDWEYGEDAERALSAAVSRYDSGHAVIVQCRAGELTVVVQGMEFGKGRRQLDIVRADGRRDRQPWIGQSSGAAGAEAPGRAARMMRGGGAIQFRTSEGRPTVRLGLDLPSESSNVDRVLTACGRPLEDERDSRPIFAGELNERSFRRVYNRRDATIPLEDGAAMAEVTCIVGDDLKLRDCVVEQALPTGTMFGLGTAERLTGVEVDPVEGQPAAGTVHHVSWSSMLEVVIDVEIID